MYSTWVIDIANENVLESVVDSVAGKEKFSGIWHFQAESVTRRYNDCKNDSLFPAKPQNAEDSKPNYGTVPRIFHIEIHPNKSKSMRVCELAPPKPVPKLFQDAIFHSYRDPKFSVHDHHLIAPRPAGESNCLHRTFAIMSKQSTVKPQVHVLGGSSLI